MSRDIIIQEGGVGRQLTVDKLKTALVEGGTCLWVPEDDAKLGTKTITKNGTYKAVDDELYGYSEVTVRGIGHVTGKDKDGNEVHITTDEDGNIIQAPLPSYIQVEVDPTKTDYVDGELINPAGLVVKAYNEDGTLWTDDDHPDGVIPISELYLPEPAADISKTEHEQEYAEYADTGTYQIQSVGSIYQAIDYAMTLFNGKLIEGGIINNYVKSAVARYEGVNPGMVAVLVDAPQGFNGWSPFTVYVFTDCEVGDTIELGERRAAGPEIRTRGVGRDGELRLTEYAVGSASMAARAGVSPNIPGYGIYVSTIGAVSVDGQTIPVQWMRPGDGVTLETSFEIKVTEA